MKQLVASRTLAIPDDVSIEVKARKVRVKGPRGECAATPALLPHHAQLVCMHCGHHCTHSRRTRQPSGSSSGSGGSGKRRLGLCSLQQLCT